MAKLREEDKKPSDVTHVDDNGVSYSYLGENKYAVWMDKAKRPYWREMPYNNIECASSIRSVSDIDTIAELESKLTGSEYTLDLICVKYKELEAELAGLRSVAQSAKDDEGGPDICQDNFR